MSLQGKSVLITGGGTGIGAQCALALAKEGCRVAIAGRREDKLQEVATKFSGEPALLYRVADVANRPQTIELVNWAESQLGQIDILINSAGINIQQRKMDVLEAEDWDRVLTVNATGTFNAIFAALPGMRARREGLIINISSVAGVRANPLGGAAYNASKFAVTGFGTTLANEERANGIRVTNVYPGEVDTPILEQRPVPVTAEHRARILQPCDVAAMVVAVARLPPRAHVSDLVIKPAGQEFF